MRRLGSEFELKEEKERELLLTYRKHLMADGEVKLHECVEQTINSPCSRFWVSLAQAERRIRQMLSGSMLPGMSDTKREMYNEIFRRYQVVRQQYPDWSDKDCISVVIKQPAPKFYLTVNSAIVIIHNIKKSWKRKREL